MRTPVAWRYRFEPELDWHVVSHAGGIPAGNWPRFEVQPLYAESGTNGNGPLSTIDGAIDALLSVTSFPEHKTHDAQYLRGALVAASGCAKSLKEMLEAKP